MPLPAVILGVDEIKTTPIGFGCTSLFRISSSVQRSRLLGTAYDAGVRHFDVAPMYGLGRAEHELGSFARTRRDTLIITTKFGINPTMACRGLAHVQAPLRRFLEARPAVRDRASARVAGPGSGRPGRLLYSQDGYHAAGARRSLERSLRALNMDYVDLLLLHDPIPGSVRSDEVSSYLEEARTSGLIRSWGIAGDPGPTAQVADSFRRRVPVLQVRDDIFLQSLQSAPSGSAFITFGAIGRALPPLVHHVTADDSRRARWQARIGSDCGVIDIAASFLLRSAFRQNPAGVVLFSTTTPSRIRSAVAAFELSRSPVDPAHEAFQQLVDAELRESPQPEGASS